MIYTQEGIYSIQNGCPWYEAQQFYGPANVKWCEATRCSYISEPANTWSNLSYLAVFMIGIMIYRKTREIILRDYALSVFVVGLCSSIYHATNNFFSQFFDFFGMFVMSSFLMSFQWQRIKRAMWEDYNRNFWMFLFVNSTIFWMLHLHKIPVQFSMIFAALGMIGFEVVALWRDEKRPKLKYFVSSIIVLAIAHTFAMMDLHRFYCRPENLILHGHALWHLVAGLGLGLLAIHLKLVTAFKSAGRN